MKGQRKKQACKKKWTQARRIKTERPEIARQEGASTTYLQVLWRQSPILAQSCNFCNCLHDSLIRDRIVLGIKDSRARKRLLQQQQLTLQRCVDICKASEALKHTD